MNNRKSFSFCTIFTILLSATLPTAADTDNKRKEKENITQTLDKVMVIGSPANASEVPGSAHVVTSEDIQEQNYDDINQVLRKVPGVYLRQEDGFGLFANISLRGADISRSAKLTLMEDGVLTAPAPYSAPEAYYTPTVGRMSGLEVLKGSSQVRYGPQTTGGVINYLSTPIPLQRRAYIRTSYGSFGDMRTHAYAGNTVATRAGLIGFLLEGYVRRNDGYKTIDQTPDFLGDDTGFKKKDPMIKLSWEPNTNMYQRFELKYGQSDLDANVTYLGLSEADFAANPFRRYAASRFDNIQSNQSRSYLRYIVAPSDDTDIIATLYHNEFSRNWYKLKDLRNVNGSTLGLARALAGAQNGEGLECLRGELACTLRVRANNRDYESEGLDVVGYYRFGANGIDHEISAGIRFNQDQVRRFQWDDDYSQQANGAITAVIPGAPGGAGNRLQKTDALAVFLQDSIQMGSWGIISGVRLERLEQAFEDYNSPEKSGNNRMNLWAASLGSTYKFNEKWMGFVSVNRGFSPPSPKSAVNGIKEETSLAYELGARYTNDSRSLTMEAVAFYTKFNDLIVIDNIGGTGTGETESFGRVNSRGLELAIQYDAGADNDWALHNPWFLTATYTNATQSNAATSTDPDSIFSYGKPGNKVPYIPELVLSFGTGIESNRWGAHISGNYVSETFTSASNTEEQIDGAGNPDARFGKTNAYFVVDASAFFRLGKNAKLFAGVQNAGDRIYLVSRQPAGPRPGMPLFAYTGLEITF